MPSSLEIARDSTVKVAQDCLNGPAPLSIPPDQKNGVTAKSATPYPFLPSTQPEGYSWGVQTWRHGRQIWNKWVGDRLVGSWEPDGRLPRDQVLEWYRKWTLNLRSEDWRKGC